MVLNMKNSYCYFCVFYIEDTDECELSYFNDEDRGENEEEEE